MTMSPRLTRWIAAGTAAVALVGITAVAVPAASAATTYAYTLGSSGLNVGFAADGSIQSLKVAGDLYDTEYVMNPDVAPDQGNESNVKYKQWLGNLMFSYGTGTGAVSASGVGSTAWKSAWTTSSAAARTVAKSADGKTITVTYQNSTDANGIRDFKLVETYSMGSDGALVWSQTVTNTGSSRLVIGDWGVPIPDNELWKSGVGSTSIYESRVLAHSYVGKNGSYVTLQRPSGLGPGVVISADTATGSGFEYQDRWRTEEVGNTTWAWNASNEGSNIKGLNVYYAHSMAIQKTSRGYLGSTSLAINAGASKTYTYRIAKTTNAQNVKDTLYGQGLLDATVVPGMVVPYDQTAQVALRVNGTITGVTATNLNDLGSASFTNPTVTYSRANGNYKIYTIAFDATQLGNNRVTVSYTDGGGRARTSVLQFYVTGRTADILDQHASFIVNKTQWNTSDGITTDDIRYKTFDDWMMNAANGSRPTSTTAPQGRRNSYAGYWGLGDDWGLTHGTFLAQKNVGSPVQAQVQALDDYLEKAVWEHLMGNTADGANPSYLVYDFWEQGKPGALNDTPSYRGYAYPHIYNTYFAMYQIEKQNPSMITYAHSAQWYLNTAYQIFKELYDGPVAYNYGTGLMGEQTTPALISALQTEGMTAAANDVVSKMATKYQSFAAQTYPYGSEYTYDNTGEESVYTLAKLNANSDATNAQRVMRDIVSKTQAARGAMPVWYWYADPTTITGENWWQFQYSTALVGYAIDDYINHTSVLQTGTNAVSSSDRSVLQRLNYAAKTALLSSINSGQISNHPANIGASAWTYQSEKGNLGTLGLGGGSNVQLLNGWRGMTGESDLGLWGTLQTLSTDLVTDDPIFGTVAYGGTTTSDQYSNTVIPKDGLARRLNLVTQQLSFSLDNDRYTQAIVGKNSADVRIDMQNVSGAAHSGSLSVSGLAQGSYAVVVNGTSQGKINVYVPPSQAGQLRAPTVVKYTVPAGSSYIVHLVSTEPDANQAPVVDAGADQSGITVGLDPIDLSGAATDDGLGSPNGTLTTTWSVTSKPAGATATFSNASILNPRVTVSAAGTYVFTLTGSDGELSSSDSVQVVVSAPQPMPTNWVTYTFDSSSNGTSPDSSGNGNDLALKGAATTATDGTSTVLRLTGADGVYGQLPDDIMARSSSSTIITRVKLDSVDTFSRIFDFGSSTQKYMFLTPKGGDGHLLFAITTGGNGEESQITTNYTMTAGSWTTIKLTFQPNTDGTTTGTISVNGTQVGQNTAMALAPKDLGHTTGDYLGKSQFADPYLAGSIDSFEIHGDIR